MSVPIFYIESFDVLDASLILNEDTSKHVVQVLRMAEGENIQLTDGKGNLIDATIAVAHKKKCIVNKIALTKIPPLKKNISIAISLIKNTNRFEWFLEKATEIGVSAIIPLLCDRTEKQQFKLERFRGILISAMLQSKQCWLPLLTEPCPVKQIIVNNNYVGKYVAHCENDHEKTILHSVNHHKPSIILIGPEGDFSKEEISLALINNFMPVSLGVNRLRTETAGIVAATMMNQ